MTRSLRFRLAARAAASVTGATVVIALASIAGARAFLDHEIESSLLNVASIQASALTGEPGGGMRFHEWNLTPDEAAQLRDLNRYAQVWNASGESLLRSQFITDDLPLDAAALRTAAAGRLAHADQRFQGMPVRSLYYPLERMGTAHARHVLQVAAPLTARNRLLGRLSWLLAAITVVVGTASFVGGWWLGGRMVRPVREIMDQAESLRPGVPDQRIRADLDTQEYERLVDVLNTMLARIEASFASQRRFTADASHELRGPLTALRGEIEVALRRERDPGEYRRVLESNLQEVGRLSQLTEDLLTLARSDAGVMQPRLELIDVQQRVRAVVERLAPRAAAKEIRLGVAGDGDSTALVDPGLIDRLMWNLVENAIKFTPHRGSVSIDLERDGGELTIRVRDSGPGLGRDDDDRIFERFFRADAARTPEGDASGTGLGLSIVRAIADSHGGRVTARNAPGGGALFEVVLPAEPV